MSLNCLEMCFKEKKRKKRKKTKKEVREDLPSVTEVQSLFETTSAKFEQETQKYIEETHKKLAWKTKREIDSSKSLLKVMSLKKSHKNNFNKQPPEIINRKNNENKKIFEKEKIDLQDSENKEKLIREKKFVQKNIVTTQPKGLPAVDKKILQKLFDKSNL